jgi:hypothetical protein
MAQVFGLLLGTIIRIKTALLLMEPRPALILRRLSSGLLLPL